jgi:Icc-related predicted phosphoesterase
MRILVISDIHGAVEKIPKILKVQLDVDLVLIVGDLTQQGGKIQAREVVAPIMDEGFPLLAVPGNMDTEGVLDYLEECNVSIHGRGRIVNGIGFFGVGGSNHTPFHTPFELSDTELSDCLDAGFKTVSDCEYTVLVSHAPPYGTQLDKSYGGVHCGSKIVAEYIKMKTLTLCVCGHIHESRNQEMIGNTMCVNVGAVKENNYCIIELINSAVKIIRRKVA